MKNLILASLAFFTGLFCLQAQPIANFEVNSTEGCSPLSVTFDASSSIGDIVEYSWDFFEYGSYVSSSASTSMTYWANSWSGVGTYDVFLTVTDSDGLTATHLATNLITVFPPSTLTYFDTTLCQGESFVMNGTVYDESNVFGTEFLTSYHGCDSIVQVAVDIASSLTIINQEINHIPCSQSIGGSLSFDLTCGTAPYTYNWDPVLPGVENSASNLAEGTYWVTVTDSDSNTAVDTFQILDPGPIGLSLNAIVDPVCIDGQGSVEVEMPGGLPPYRIFADGVDLGWSINSSSFTLPLEVGTYEIGLVDANNCEELLPNPVTITNATEPIEIESTYPVDAEVCTGTSVEIGVNAIGAISYNWFPSASLDCPSCPSTIASPATTTMYYCQVENVSGCTIQDSVLVIVLQSPYTVLDPTLCSGESIDVNGTIYNEANPAGTEYFPVSNGCDSVVQVMLNFTNQIEIVNEVVENVPAQQSSGGSISFDVDCGVAPFTYAWSPVMPGIENIATDLSAGTYTVTVTDDIGSTIENSYIITAPNDTSFLELYNVVLVSNPGCEGGFGEGGCVQFDWVGGVPPYSIRRGNGSPNGAWVGSNISLTSYENCFQWTGTHEYWVEDANGLRDTFPNLITIVADFPAPEVSIPSGDLSGCEGDTILFEAVAPTANSFQWYFWGGTLDCDSCLSTDAYLSASSDAVIEVQDANGCWNWDTIYVEVIDCDKVWPGDTDTSNFVDNFDLINIGLAFDSVGPVRQNASLAWFGQLADPWMQNINGNGANFKHSDTDGNGIVNADDTLAILQNWGLMHNFTGGPVSQFIPDYPPVVNNSGVTAPFYVQPDTFEQGEMVMLSVILGEDGAPSEDVYGIAFSLEYDMELIAPGSAYLTFDESWAGDINQDMISIQRTFSDFGRIDVGLTRTDHTNMTGFGQLAELFITIEDDILFQGNPEVEAITTVDALFNITNVVIVNKDGEALSVIPMETTSLVEGEISATNNIKLSKQIQVFPNPANDQIVVNAKNLIIEELTVFKLTGGLIKHNNVNTNKTKVSTVDLENGVYIVRIQTKEGIVNKRILVQH